VTGDSSWDSVEEGLLGGVRRTKEGRKEGGDLARERERAETATSEDENENEQAILEDRGRETKKSQQRMMKKEIKRWHSPHPDLNLC